MSILYSPRITAVLAAVLALALPAGAAKLSMSADTDAEEPRRLARFEIDTEANTLRYELAEALREKSVVARIHGFAPRGWDAKSLVELPESGTGQWKYREIDELNILDGLAYLVVAGRTKSFRGQIELVEQPIARFDADGGTVVMAGTCNTSTSQIVGVVDGARVDLRPAQVQMELGKPTDPDRDGLRDVALNVAVRVGGGYIEGLGKIQVEMLGDRNPAHVEALQKGADFPAVMTMDLRKRYITPAGTFVSEREPYRAERIDRFPPFGVELRPMVDSVRLLDEKTGKPVGTLGLGPIVALYHVDSSVFPVDDPDLPTRSE